jgi:hypothetical protein
MATDAATQLGDEKYLDYLAQVSAEVDDCASRRRGRTVEGQQGQETMPPEVAQQEVPGGVVDGEAAPRPAIASRNVYVRQQEALSSIAKDPSAGPGRWYTLLASYRLDDAQTVAEQVRAFSQGMQRLRRVDPRARLEVYRTGASDSFAIVLTPQRADRDGARALVGPARWLGAPDAAIQPDQNWRLCPAPYSAENLRRCASARSAS